MWKDLWWGFGVILIVAGIITVAIVFRDPAYTGGLMEFH